MTFFSNFSNITFKSCISEFLSTSVAQSDSDTSLLFQLKYFFSTSSFFIQLIFVFFGIGKCLTGFFRLFFGVTWLKIVEIVLSLSFLDPASLVFSN